MKPFEVGDRVKVYGQVTGYRLEDGDVGQSRQFDSNGLKGRVIEQKSHPDGVPFVQVKLDKPYTVLFRAVKDEYETFSAVSVHPKQCRRLVEKKLTVSTGGYMSVDHAEAMKKNWSAIKKLTQKKTKKKTVWVIFEKEGAYRVFADHGTAEFYVNMWRGLIVEVSAEVPGDWE